MPTSLMQNRLIILKSYLDSEALTYVSRRRLLEQQVRTILNALDKELEQDRGAILAYLRLLGFDDLLAEYP